MENKLNLDILNKDIKLWVRIMILKVLRWRKEMQEMWETPKTKQKIANINLIFPVNKIYFFIG